jgi:hypothetical protein
LLPDGLRGFADANWGNSDDTRHSIAGYIYCINGGAVSWSSKKQHVVALSTTEAEYIALTHAAKEAVWLRALFTEIYDSRCAHYPVQLFSDNKSAIHLVQNNVFHSRTKHIDIRYHYIRELYSQGILEIDHRGTTEMPADMLTKPLPRAKLELFAQMSGLGPV